MSFYQEVEIVLKSISPMFIIFFIILGSCLGSFFNVVILRYQAMVEHENAIEIKEWFLEKDVPFPEKLTPLLTPFNISFPASHCSCCKTPLKWYHNIPILSYIFLRGKCGFCKSKISIQYPIVEAVGGAILATSYIMFMPQGLTVFLIAATLFMSLFVLVCLDLKCFMLPDTINYSLMWLGILSALHQVSFTQISLQSSIYGAIFGYLLLYFIAVGGKLLFKKDAMGNGDFKLMAALGTFIAIKGVFFTVFFSPFIGLSTWLIFKLMKKDTNMIPYGPSLILSAIIYLIWGNEILRFLNIVL